MPFESYVGHGGTVTLPGICRFAFAERPFRRRDKTLQVQTPRVAETPAPSSK
jgi:hypothetical protein